uniref:DOMON domain-containing protein n=1 Tax=Steinernema glaseri TaxID=37863 RepID=A0A1I7YME1_9BILA
MADPVRAASDRHGGVTTITPPFGIVGTLILNWVACGTRRSTHHDFSGSRVFQPRSGSNITYRFQAIEHTER